MAQKILRHIIINVDCQGPFLWTSRRRPTTGHDEYACKPDRGPNPDIFSHHSLLSITVYRRHLLCYKPQLPGASQKKMVYRSLNINWDFPDAVVRQPRRISCCSLFVPPTFYLF